MSRRSRRSQPTVIALLLLAVGLMGFSSLAAGQQIRQIRGPSKRALLPERVAAAGRARAQVVSPAAIEQSVAAMDASAAGLRGIAGSALRAELSVAPQRARLAVFTREAARRGTTVATFDRRLRGMLKRGPAERVAHPMKTFVEVTRETFDLFATVYGPNNILFAASPRPGHLHTLVRDQSLTRRLTHNTYGKGPLTRAQIGREQYVAPVQLTGLEMERFVRYLNAGVAADDRAQVYGFKTSSGQLVCDTQCTNWATSAPIGELQRWIRPLENRVKRAAQAGELPPVFADGLHAALAAASTGEERAALVAQVVALKNLARHTRSSARRLGKEFDLVAEHWPLRPRDLVGRESLADVLGINRSQDPAKFMYDLFLNKRVPVIAVFTPEASPAFADTTFELELMGRIDSTGNVLPSLDWAGRPSTGHGVVPADRRPAPPAEPQQ